MSPLSDLVRDSLLATTFPGNGTAETVHVYHERSLHERRQVARSERWIRRGRIGQGGFASVWWEERADQCDSDREKPAMRAVKEINLKGRAGGVDYTRGLEAIAKFSQPASTVDTPQKSSPGIARDIAEFKRSSAAKELYNVERTTGSLATPPEISEDVAKGTASLISRDIEEFGRLRVADYLDEDSISRAIASFHTPRLSNTNPREPPQPDKRAQSLRFQATISTS
ncbi:hypothetical protein BJX68DRAFT_266146 [Aspergillus pseudodeflectus]|uniref:Protein kinase domain-containing protein n=1 Tax=Aspergillus pseudodeflectus TaxID=176178 RepID=A0ABR4KG52_9EURO